jgi:hypothetical protein
VQIKRAKVQEHFANLAPCLVAIALCNDPQKDTQLHIPYSPITLHEVTQPLWH